MGGGVSVSLGAVCITTRTHPSLYLFLVPHPLFSLAVYPAFWALEAFYSNTSDFGVTALRYLTCNGTKSWLGMLRQGATTTMVRRA